MSLGAFSCPSLQLHPSPTHHTHGSQQASGPTLPQTEEEMWAPSPSVELCDLQLDSSV